MENFNIQDCKNKISEFFHENNKIYYAFLFGSVLTKHLLASDIDILISADFESCECLDYSVELEQIFKRKIDLVLVEKSKCYIIMEAFSKGEKVFVRDQDKLKKDYYKNYYLYQDWIYIRKLRVQELKRDFADK